MRTHFFTLKVHGEEHLLFFVVVSSGDYASLNLCFRLSSVCIGLPFI